MGAGKKEKKFKSTMKHTLMGNVYFISDSNLSSLLGCSVFQVCWLWDAPSPTSAAYLQPGTLPDIKKFI